MFDLAMHDRAGVLDLLDLERVLVRHEPGERERAVGALQADGLEVVFDDHRDAVQRTGQAALLEALIHRVGLLQRFGIGDDDGVDGRAVLVERVDALQILLDEAAAGQAPGLHRRMDLRDGRFVDFERRRRLRRGHAPSRRRMKDGNELLDHGGMIPWSG